MSKKSRVERIDRLLKQVQEGRRGRWNNRLSDEERKHRKKWEMDRLRAMEAVSGRQISHVVDKAPVGNLARQKEREVYIRSTRELEKQYQNRRKVATRQGASAQRRLKRVERDERRAILSSPREPSGAYPDDIAQRYSALHELFIGSKRSLPANARATRLRIKELIRSGMKDTRSANRAIANTGLSHQMLTINTRGVRTERIISPIDSFSQRKLDRLTRRLHRPSKGMRKHLRNAKAAQRRGR